MSRSRRPFIAIATMVLVLAALLVPFPLSDLSSGPATERYVAISARQFAFDPGVVRVNRGDTVVLDLEATDAIHGLSVDGYDVSLQAEPGHRAQATFVADREGKFKFRCSITCGTLHPFMIGEIVVAPNLPLGRAVLATLITLVGALAFFWRKAESHLAERRGPTPDRIEISALSLAKRALRSRWLPWSLIALTLPFFVLAIMSGLMGTPAGNRNFGIVFVWIVWWALAVMLLVPFAGRLWCAMCPIPAPGEWLQRRALVQPRSGGRLYTRGWKWPRRLSNIWLQNGSFLAVALFSAVILTTPLVSALALLLFVVVGIAASLLFERRVFCRYLCPVGGFIGLYSQVAPVEVRVKDRGVCARHREKTCYSGSDEGYGCPWLVFPGALEKNTYCGMCAECFKTCPLDNVGLYARPFGSDLLSLKGRRLDEAFKGFIMLTCALIYSAVLIGPWAFLKETALAVSTLPWLAYALAFLAANLVLLPGLFYLCALLARRLGGVALGPRRLFVDYAYALVPLGLAAWGAFSLAFVLVNLSYAWPVMSDPFGWGWDLFGTAAWSWTPYAAGLVPYLQVPILLAGLVGATAVALRTAQAQGGANRVALPFVAFAAAFTLGLVWLYVA